MSDERANASFYIDIFGRVDPQNYPLASRAIEVFNQIKRAADSEAASASLVIIDTEARPWAIALADGNVVLSRGALDIIYGSVNQEIGDARLAFVLGHELAHLGSRDLWQQHVFSSLSAIPDLADSALSVLHREMTLSVFDAAAWRERELKADEVGYMIASLAGFDVRQIFADDALRKDFLSVWEIQTQSVGDTHYNAAVRSEFLQVRLAAASERLDQFQLGVMLAHVGRYEDALAVFENFQTFFSSRAVLTNLGYVHLQLAREAMPFEMAYRYWMPTVLEQHSGFRIPTRSFVQGLNEKALYHLEEATRYLDQALKLNPADVSSSVNLTVSHHYLGKHFRARAVVEDALNEHPDNTMLSVLKSIVLVDQEPEIDMWPRAVSRMQALDTGAATPVFVIYNLARMHQERERYGKAKEYWDRLYARLPELPLAYQYQVCAVVELDCLMEEATASFDVGLPNGTEFYPFQPGAPLDVNALKLALPDAELVHWQIQELIGVTITRGQSTAFVLDGVIEMVRHESGFSEFEGLDISGQLPLDIELLAHGSVHRYPGGVSLVEREGKFTELWVSQSP